VWGGAGGVLYFIGLTLKQLSNRAFSNFCFAFYSPSCTAAENMPINLPLIGKMFANIPSFIHYYCLMNKYMTTAIFAGNKKLNRTFNKSTFNELSFLMTLFYLSINLIFAVLALVFNVFIIAMSVFA
jgi:hypothetical protein